MAERYDVLVRVVSQKGICSAEHKVGDEWVIGRHTPPGMCLSASQGNTHNWQLYTRRGR